MNNIKKFFQIVKFTMKNIIKNKNDLNAASPGNI